MIRSASLARKKDKKDKQIEDLTAQLDDLRKRNLAEFENFRKRTEKEKSTMFDMGAKSVVEKLLPIIDNFERGFAGLSEEQMSDPFVSGMDMVYKQLVKHLQIWVLSLLKQLASHLIQTCTTL